MAQKRIDIFNILADPTRRRILTILAARPLAAGDIARRFPQCRPAISKHLTILKRAGLLLERRDAQRRLYSIRSEALHPITTFLESLRSEASPEESTPPAKPTALEAVKQSARTRRSVAFELEFD